MSKGLSETDALRPGSTAPTLATGAMGAIMLFSAAVQYNDPDPLPWIAFYLIAAAVSFAAVWKPQAWLAPAAVAVVALVWSATLLPAAARTSFPELFRSWEMMSHEMEVGRELGGLLLTAVWTAYLALRGRRLRA